LSLGDNWLSVNALADKANSLVMTACCATNMIGGALQN
jgi:hypothetical protein